jgi:hypothetical protein
MIEAKTLTKSISPLPLRCIDLTLRGQASRCSRQTVVAIRRSVRAFTEDDGQHDDHSNCHVQIRYSERHGNRKVIALSMGTKQQHADCQDRRTACGSGAGAGNSTGAVTGFGAPWFARAPKTRPARPGHGPCHHVLMVPSQSSWPRAAPAASA